MLKFGIFIIIWGVFMILFPQIIWELQKLSHPIKNDGEAPDGFIWVTRFIGLILIIVGIVGIVYYYK